MKIIKSADAPGSPNYSQAVVAGGFLFVSGMTGVDPLTGKLAGATIQEQAACALQNCEAILGAAGALLQDVVEVQVLLARPEDFAGLNDAYARFFPSDPPARSVAKLGVEIPGVLVSIRMVAVAPFSASRTC
jgi:2-iminobutanoate/2-iminopropanoate deaminase